MTKVLGFVLVVALLAACGDDGYTAPDREVTMAEILENRPTILTMLEHEAYVQAWEVVAEIEGLDPTDPESYLEIYDSSAIPHRVVSEVVVGCAWGAALRDGGDVDLRTSWHEQLGTTEGFEQVRDRVLDNTGDGDCSTLDRHRLAEVSRDLPGSVSDVASWVLAAEIQKLEGSIGLELAPEIAEAHAG